MDRRTILAVVLSFFVFLIFTFLGEKYGSKTPTKAPTPKTAETTTPAKPAPPAPASKAVPPAPGAGVSQSAVHEFARGSSREPRAKG